MPDAGKLEGASGDGAEAGAESGGETGDGAKARVEAGAEAAGDDGVAAGDDPASAAKAIRLAAREARREAAKVAKAEKRAAASAADAAKRAAAKAAETVKREARAARRAADKVAEAAKAEAKARAKVAKREAAWEAKLARAAEDQARNAAKAAARAARVAEKEDRRAAKAEAKRTRAAEREARKAAKAERVAASESSRASMAAAAGAVLEQVAGLVRQASDPAASHLVDRVVVTEGPEPAAPADADGGAEGPEPAALADADAALTATDAEAHEAAGSGAESADENMSSDSETEANGGADAKPEEDAVLASTSAAELVVESPDVPVPGWLETDATRAAVPVARASQARELPPSPVGNAQSPVSRDLRAPQARDVPEDPVEDGDEAAQPDSRASQARDVPRDPREARVAAAEPGSGAYQARDATEPVALDTSVPPPPIVVPEGAVVGATVDVGATSVHLLVAAIGDHRVDPLIDESVFLGLGDRVAADGRLGPEAREELVAALVAYADHARDLGAARITVVGTEPMRRAADAAAVVTAVEARAGVPFHVLSHDEEGLLTLLGVTMGRPIESSLLVVDIGGGSTEFVVVDPEGHVSAVGLPLGAARLTRDLVRSDPPSLVEIETLRARVREIVRDAPSIHPGELLAVGGTASNLLRLLPATALDRVLTRRRLTVALAMLTVERSLEAAERHLVRPARARILPAGALIVDAILERYGADRMRVSDEGIREGLALAAATAGAAWRDRLPALVRGWPDEAPPAER
jgi:exopolyphosphatase/guanosine-5'-triphosphate,3'-diphosphate pyrophosphatase